MMCVEGRAKVMIYYLLLICVPLVSCLQSISQKQYNLRIKEPNIILFSAFTSLIALGFFVVSSGFRLEFDTGLVPYALCFAVCYASAWVGTVFAVRYGLMAITNLIISCSLIFPTMYGVLMGETATPMVIVGICMLLAAFVLVNLKSGSKGSFSLKWFVCVMIAFVGNGGCSISQNMQKRALGDSYSHEFMIIALAAATVMLFAAAIYSSKDIKSDIKMCLPYAAGNGIANAVVNLLIITLIGNIPNTILYPTNSALGMAVTFLISYFAYKERFSVTQYIGYAMGMASIVILNI